MVSLKLLPLSLPSYFTQRDQLEPPIDVLQDRVFSLPLDLLFHRVMLHKSEHRPQATAYLLKSMFFHFKRHLIGVTNVM